MQGKFINDKEVLLEAAKAAGIRDAEAVVEDETIEAKEASFPSSFSLLLYNFPCECLRSLDVICRFPGSLRPSGAQSTGCRTSSLTTSLLCQAPKILRHLKMSLIKFCEETGRSDCQGGQML